MNTWLYPGWTQGSDNEKIREETETREEESGMMNCPGCGEKVTDPDRDGCPTCRPDETARESVALGARHHRYVSRPVVDRISYERR